MQHLIKFARSLKNALIKRVWVLAWVKKKKKISSPECYSRFLDLPPPPEPPPGQGLRQPVVPGQRGGSAERKGSSLERQHASVDDTKSSLDRPARTSLEWQRQAQEWISSTDRQEDFRKAQHKQAFGSGVCALHRPRRGRRLLRPSAEGLCAWQGSRVTPNLSGRALVRGRLENEERQRERRGGLASLAGEKKSF